MSWRSRRAATGCAVGVISMLACGPSVPLVRRTQHPANGGVSPVAVDAPPPPAEIETIPSAPSRDCAWLDGQWMWLEHGWEWVSGSWVQVEPGCAYARPLAVWVPDVDGRGTLFYTHGQWYRDDSGAVCPPPRPCIGEP